MRWLQVLPAMTHYAERKTRSTPEVRQTTQLSKQPMQTPPRHPVTAMQPGAKDPKSRTIGIFHPVVIPNQVGFRSPSGLLVAPPFGSNPLGSRGSTDTMRHTTPGEPDRWVVRNNGDHLDLLGPPQQP